MDKLSDLLEIAKQAAQSSGNFLKNEFHQDQEASLNKGRDIKLKIDIESEKLILEFIKKIQSYQFFLKNLAQAMILETLIGL